MLQQQLPTILTSTVICTLAMIYALYAEIPLDWAIPASHQPYPTENVNVGDSILFNWMGLHNVYSLNGMPPQKTWQPGLVWHWRCVFILSTHHPQDDACKVHGHGTVATRQI